MHSVYSTVVITLQCIVVSLLHQTHTHTQNESLYKANMHVSLDRKLQFFYTTFDTYTHTYIYKSETEMRLDHSLQVDIKVSEGRISVRD